MDINSYIYKLEQKYNVTVIYLTKSGSTLYGTNGPNSDVDYKGVFLSEEDDILLGKDLPYITYSSGNTSSANTAEDVDIHLDSLQTFIKLLAKGETGAIDLLFSTWSTETTIMNSWTMKNIQKNYTKFYGKNLQAFVGYCVGQSKKYNIKGARYNELVKFNQSMSPNINSTNKLSKWLKDPVFTHYLTMFKHINIVQALGPRGAEGNVMEDYLEVLGKKYHGDVSIKYLIDRLTEMEEQFGSRAKKASEGVDWKTLSHAVRVIIEVEELLETNFIQFPLKQADFIKQIKDGKLPIEDILTLIEQKIQTVDQLMLTSTVQEVANREYTDNFLLQTIKG